MKRIIACITLIVALTIMAGCSKEIKLTNSTPEEAASFFVKSLISADEEMIGMINRSDSMLYPTHYLISDVCNNYSGMDIKDFKFISVEGKYSISVYCYNEKKDLLREILVKKIDEAYYFSNFAKLIGNEKEDIITGYFN